MKHLFLTLLIMVLLCPLVQGQIYPTTGYYQYLPYEIRDDSELITITATNSNVTGTIALGSAIPLEGVIGQVILNTSTYITGGWGLEDTAFLMVRSTIGGLVQTVDSVKCLGLPCTLDVNSWEDSLFGMTWEVDYEWGDSGVVVTDSESTCYLNWLFKIVNDR